MICLEGSLLHNIHSQPMLLAGGHSYTGIGMEGIEDKFDKFDYVPIIVFDWLIRKLIPQKMCLILRVRVILVTSSTGGGI